MCYVASTIAGYFIERANKEDHSLSVLQLTKLVYISHGWNLALYNMPLISGKIEARKYDPVMSLYSFFEGMGLKKDDLVEKFPPIEEVNCIKAQHLELLNKVYVKYGQMSDEQLTDMLHEEDTLKNINKDSFEALPTISPIDSKEKATAFLKRAGILDGNGKLYPYYVS